MRVYHSNNGLYVIPENKVEPFIEDLITFSKNNRKDSVSLLSVFIKDISEEPDVVKNPIEINHAKEKGIYKGVDSLNNYILEMMVGAAPRDKNGELKEGLMIPKKFATMDIIGNEGGVRVYEERDFLIHPSEIEDIIMKYAYK